MKEKHDLTNLMPILSLVRGTSSQSVRDYCLSHKGVPELEAVLLKGEVRRVQFTKTELTGNLDTAGREVTVELEKKLTYEQHMQWKTGLENIVIGVNWIKHESRTILARINVRLKLEVGHPSRATSVAMLGHILGGKQNALHTKKNVETVDVKTILRDAAKVQLKRDRKVV